MVDYKNLRLEREREMLDEYVASFKNFYLNDEIIDSQEKRSTPLQDRSVHDNMNEKNVAYLQEILDIAKIVECDDKLIFHTLLQSDDKPVFTQYLLSKKQLDIPVNELDNDKNTVFMLLANRVVESDKNYPICTIKSLINRGYKITDDDVQFIKDLYQLDSIKHSPKKQILWSHLRLLTILNDVEKYDFITHYQKLNAFFAIVSFKLNNVFGSKHDNLLAMSNNAISNYKRHIDIILHALNFYDRRKDIETADKKGTFAKKKQERLDAPVEQDKVFEEIIFAVLPELKHSFQKTA